MENDQKHFQDNDRQRTVSEATRQAEEGEFEAAHEADRPATREEEAALDDRPVEPTVRKHYDEMTERGKSERGEGRID
jgi:hypothetical protein